jgi:nickel superoxide dismutase
MKTKLTLLLYMPIKSSFSENILSSNWLLYLDKLNKINMKTIKYSFTLALVAILFGVSSQNAKAHCEIPCGIYGDSVRVTLLYEHIQTIEKSMSQINELSEQEDVNYNQLVRWVMNKDEHATKMQEIISQYFLHQRIKVKDSSQTEEYATYIKQLTLMHQLSVLAMKAKQGTDLEYIEKMRVVLHDFEHVYFAGHKH